MGSLSRKLKRPGAGKRRASVVTAVAELRRRVRFAKGAGETFGYFDATLLRNDAFMGMGAPSDHAPLESLVLGLLEKNGMHEPLRRQQLVSVPEFQLWHGYLLYEGASMARVIYFADLNRGLCAAGRQQAPLADPIWFSIPESPGEP